MLKSNVFNKSIMPVGFLAKLSLVALENRSYTKFSVTDGQLDFGCIPQWLFELGYKCVASASHHHLARFQNIGVMTLTNQHCNLCWNLIPTHLGDLWISLARLINCFGEFSECYNPHQMIENNDI